MPHAADDGSAGTGNRRANRLSATQTAGLFIGAIIIAAAAFTVVRHREFSHLVPIGVLVVGIVVASVVWHLTVRMPVLAGDALNLRFFSAIFGT